MAIAIKKPKPDELIFGDAAWFQIIQSKIKDDKIIFILEPSSFSRHRFQIKTRFIQKELLKKDLIILSDDPAYKRFLYLKGFNDEPTILTCLKEDLQKENLLLSQAIKKLGNSYIMLSQEYKMLQQKSILEAELLLKKIKVLTKVRDYSQEEEPGFLEETQEEA